jgi:hypothetical protein
MFLPADYRMFEKMNFSLSASALRAIQLASAGYPIAKLANLHINLS